MDIISIGIASGVKKTANDAKDLANDAKNIANNAKGTAEGALSTAENAESLAKAANCCAGVFNGNTTQSGTNIVTTVKLAEGASESECSDELDEIKVKIGAVLATNGKGWIAVHSLFMTSVVLTQRIDFLLPTMGTWVNTIPDFMETRAVIDLSALGGSGILDKTVQMRWSDIVIAENDGNWEATLTITVSMV